MRRWWAALLLCLLLGGCAARPAADTSDAVTDTADAVTVALDGAAWDGAPVPGEDDLRVYVTLDGAPLIDLPFGQPHTVTVTQPDGAENTVALTGEAVSMAHANCDNQDCVEMGEVTRDNLELRVMGGFIICLPHKLAVEVRQ